MTNDLFNCNLGRLWRLNVYHVAETSPDTGRVLFWRVILGCINTLKDVTKNESERRANTVDAWWTPIISGDVWRFKPIDIAAEFDTQLLSLCHTHTPDKTRNIEWVFKFRHAEYKKNWRNNSSWTEQNVYIGTPQVSLSPNQWKSTSGSTDLEQKLFPRFGYCPTPAFYPS